PGDAPFIMHPDGAGWIWAPSGLKDGPLPAHYEPLESNVTNPLYGQQTNPAAAKMEREDNPYASSPDERFPHVLTTYRLTEHHTAGGMSRTLSHLAELQPELFAEISPELAREVGVVNGDTIVVATARGEIEARALVTPRMPSLDVQGRRVHQVGLPYHWGGRGLVKGDIVNDLVAISEEPNVRIMEAKALTCSVRRSVPPSSGWFEEGMKEEGSICGEIHPSSFIPHPSRRQRHVTVTGFFTDSTLCIVCKACEVACKEW